MSQLLQFKQCSNSNCPFPQPLPLNAFYFIKTRGRYTAKCKKCHNDDLVARRQTTATKQFKELKEEAQKHCFYIWATQKVFELKEQLDPRITPEYLLGLLVLQDYKCLITGKQFCIPSNESLVHDTTNYADWFLKLTNVEQLCIPTLATFTKQDDLILAGCCGFIITALVPLYQLQGGLSDLSHLLQNSFLHPVIYQYTTVMQKVKELGLEN